MTGCLSCSSLNNADYTQPFVRHSGKTPGTNVLRKDQLFGRGAKLVDYEVALKGVHRGVADRDSGFRPTFLPALVRVAMHDEIGTVATDGLGQARAAEEMPDVCCVLAVPRRLSAAHQKESVSLGRIHRQSLSRRRLPTIIPRTSSVCDRLPIEHRDTTVFQAPEHFV